jgi:hypothetical protein
MMDDIAKIRDLLERAEKPVLSDASKTLIKNRLISQIREKESRGVVEYLKTIAEGVKITAYKRAIVKERVLMLAENTRQGRYVFAGGSGLMVKRFASACMVLMLCMGFFSFVGVDINVAMADSFTTIDGLKGDVVVHRDGRMQFAFEEMELYEGDVILTGDDGWASIKFLDDSVARLKEKTSLRIRRLFSDPSNSAVTRVEIEVDYGDVWSRVLNLFEDDAFFVVMAGDTATSTKKGAFNVHKDESTAVVEVYSNVVETKSNITENKVRSGEKVVNDDLVVRMANGSKDGDWVQSNLEGDKVHIAQIEEGKGEVLEDSVGSMPGSTFYPIKSLKGEVVKLLTFDDVKDKQVDLDVAERKFVEWSIMLKDDEIDQDDAEEVFDEFVSEVDSFKNVIEGVRLSGDIEYAGELEEFLKNKLSNQKKNLGGILPGNPLYTAKEYLFEAEVLSVETDEEKSLVMQRQAAFKLSEVQDLVEGGEDEKAKEALDEYVTAVEEVKEGVDALSEESKEEVEIVVTEAIEENEEVISSIDGLVEPEVVILPVITPIQSEADYGVTVSGDKPLDPLLDLGR